MKPFLHLILGISEASAQIPSEPTVGSIVTTTWNSVIRPAIIFLFVAATVIFIAGLVQFIMGADSEEARSTGKKHIMWGIVGMTIMFLAGAIMTVLDNFFQSI